MKGTYIRVLGVTALAALLPLPTLVRQMTAPANSGAHDLTFGFGRGRLDLPGLVSLGSGGGVALPLEPSILTVELSGAGPIEIRGAGTERTLVATLNPARVTLELATGGVVSIESASRLRLHSLVVERGRRPLSQTSSLIALGVLAVFFARRGPKQAIAAALFLLAAFAGITAGTLSWTFAQVAAARLLPALVVAALFLPLALACREAKFPSLREVTRMAMLGFVSSLAVTGIQLAWFQQPLPLGDPQAYFDMGGKFAEALAGLGSPLGLGPILAELQPYLALPATGLVYGCLRLLGGGLGLIYAAQAIAIAVAVASLVSICETEIGPRAAKLALAAALLHPSFSILPGIVQPEPFILAAWTLAALLALRAGREGSALRLLLGAGVLLGLGLSLHPQGLSFLLLALGICLLPWIQRLANRPSLILAPMLGVFSVLLPVVAAEHFSKPLAYVLERQYGFFAYTSPHPLGFWLFVDSDGWPGPLRIEDTTYQKELFAMKSETAVSSTFVDVAEFVARHPSESIRTLLTNLHRLWSQPDNPFALPFPLPYGIQIALHRGFQVLFVLSLPILFGSRLAILGLPFAMLSMTYPGYHIFNKYGTPALPFTILGACVLIDRLIRERGQRRLLLGGLTSAALGALLPATTAARVGLSGDMFIFLVQTLLWTGLGLALWSAIQVFGVDARSKLVSGVIGFTVLLGSSFAASQTDTTRGAWSVSLDQRFEASCHFASPRPPSEIAIPLDPAWLLVDAQASLENPPRIEVNGRPLGPAAPTMPPFGLATLRGHRDPATFRQIWRAPISEVLLASGDLTIRVDGGPEGRVFGDIRSGHSGPRLSFGDWPYLSVYRLMHEGQYRLPTVSPPPQACFASGLTGRPGIALARIPQGEEGQMALKASKPPAWIF